MIPVFEPTIEEADVAAVVAALRRGEISGTFGEALPAFEQGFAEYVGARFGVAVSSGTAALQLAVVAHGIGAGDEVLVSAATNIATAVAVVHAGAVPVPVDSEPGTYNLDLELAESLITARTRAIMPVHLFGHPVDMDAVTALAERHGLVVIDDAAEAHGAEVRGRRVGSFEATTCWSFYANKILTTGEGGMVTTSDEQLAERLRALRNLSYGRRERLMHEDVGFNFRMTGMQAALGLSQLGRIDAVIDAKRALARRYAAALADVPGLSLPTEREWARHVYWMYAVTVDESAGLGRVALAAALRERGVDTRSFFCPMNLQPALRRVPGFRPLPCPVAEAGWERGAYLPSSPGLSEADVATVAGTLRDVLGAR
ncbi:MAG: perosamine synthetase [Thermoleophilaceae bacterium]|nr:perosamine synthetase [Thermoleophilaceae bacterium]